MSDCDSYQPSVAEALAYDANLLDGLFEGTSGQTDPIGGAVDDCSLPHPDERWFPDPILHPTGPISLERESSVLGPRSSEPRVPRLLVGLMLGLGLALGLGFSQTESAHSTPKVAPKVLDVRPVDIMYGPTQQWVVVSVPPPEPSVVRVRRLSH